MEHKNMHRLTILFDQDQTGISQLWDFAQKTFSDDVTLRVGLSEDNDLVFTIEGTLEAVDKCHVQISKHLIEERQLNFFRLRDTAGDEIRTRAYPILSSIEQELRSFINRCLIDAFGFSWWASLGEVTLPGISASFRQSGHHPLELMTIEQLIGFITFEKSVWEEETPVILKDLLAVLSKSQSFDDFRTILQQKVRKVSLWQDVFSKYLSVNQEDWQRLKNKDLDFIVSLRNRVMHHRPVHIGELTALEEKRRKINEIVASAKSHLSLDERKEISELSKEIRDIYAEMVYEYSEKNAFSMIYEGLRKAKNPATIRKLSIEVDTLLSKQNFEEKEYLQLKAAAFDRMRDLIGNHIDQSRPIILEELLPLCLKDNPELRIQYSSFREILTEWIEDHLQENLSILRNELISSMIPLIGSDKHAPVCWTFSNIGYKRQDVINALWNFSIATDNEAGDLALSTLTWFGLSIEEGPMVLGELHRRIANRYNIELNFALARLGHLESIGVILDHWLSQKNRESKKVDPSLAFTAIREILEVHDTEIAIQDEVWHRVTELVEREPKSLYRDFEIGHITVECNSPYVIPTLLSWIGNHSEWFEKPDWALYLAGERFAECVKPRQLEGWSQIGDYVIFELLHQKAVTNTKSDNFASNQEALEKDNAWQTLLRAGYGEGLNWFDQAVAAEDGRFVRQKIMSYLACFRFDPLPKETIQWILEAYDDPGTGDGREMSYRMAAVRMARSTATQPAFDALLNFGFTYKGQVITQSTGAVAEVAIDLLRHGNDQVVDELAQIIIDGKVDRQRLVSAYALQTIGTFPEYQNLLLPYADALASLLHDESRVPIERGNILMTLAHLVEWAIPEKLLPDLVKWAHQPNEWIGGGSLQILAFHGYLESNPDIMQELLGIEKQGDHWTLSKPGKYFDWFPYIIGALYYRNPEAFASVIASILLDPEWQSVAQINHWLIVSHRDHTKIQLPKIIADALIKRTTRFSPFYTELVLFDALQNLAPHILLEFQNPETIRLWMPDGRVALANALAQINCNDEDRKRCLSILESLTEDGLFPVRRAAYRAISRQDSSYLYSLCNSWIVAPVINLNLRAAEACGWVEGVQTDERKDGFEDLLPLFIHHPERQVREAAKQSWEEHRKRIWSRGYLSRVLEVRGNDNREILQAWCYGDALGSIGDDECRDILSRHLSDEPLPPNIRYWIERILTRLNDSWKKVTKGWADSWIDMSGVIERGSGKFHNKHDPLVDIQYTIWYAPASIPNEKHFWGGIMIIPSLAEFIDVGLAEITTEDGRKGNILLSKLQGSTVTFLGNGPFPT